MVRIFLESLTRRCSRKVPQTLLGLTGQLVLLVGLLSSSENSAARIFPVRVDRWLEVRSVSGNVTYYQGTRSQAAKVGTRLESVGDAIDTGSNANAVLAVDTGIGIVEVSPDTTVRIKALHVNNSGGRVTQLQVNGGQARLRVRRFSNPNSELEIHTPAGVSAVRGTEFGVAVHADGRTGVATLEGSVLNMSQGKSVPLPAGYQIVMIPGQPPTTPVPIANDTRLNLRLLTAVDQNTARIVGVVDPVNLTMIAGRKGVSDRNGYFDITVPIPPNRRISAVITTPLGDRKVYELAVP